MAGLRADRTYRGRVCRVGIRGIKRGTAGRAKSVSDFYTYDIETYPNAFTVTVKRRSDGLVWRYRIDNWVNQGREFYQLLNYIRDTDGRMVGFNNVGFDYPVIHELVIRCGDIDAGALYRKAQAIIDSTDRFEHMVWQSDWFVEQVDLFKIHHFDNMARSTSLKMIENNMVADNIQDLPIPPGTVLTPDQIAKVIVPYNDHDVFRTEDFLNESMPLIEFRDTLTAKYGRDFTNHNDTKIGKDFFIMELEKAGVPCFHKIGGRRQPNQTIRSHIDLREVILPWIHFQTPEFERMLGWLKDQSIVETKGIFKGLSCSVNGFEYVFGTGGIHGSIDSQTVHSDDQYIIMDLDVASYYPNLSISNRFYPAHLSESFCDIYQRVYNQRRQHAKGTPENAMLKLALNGVYGDSNNKYSPFYDPAYTMSITLNGQLLLCLLAEYLSDVPGLSMVQINTDGLTVKCPRQHEQTVTELSSMWESITGLTLERADYSRMMIRDVNSYIAEYEGGGVKRKGTYTHGKDLGWHQNHSSQIVAIAAEAELVNGTPIAETVRNHTTASDFMRRTKVPRGSKLMLGDAQLQNITRYFVSKSGGSLIKVMPPTPSQVKKNPDAPDRRIGIDVGWNVTPCNDINDFNFSNLNYDYYINQAEKITRPLQ